MCYNVCTILNVAINLFEHSSFEQFLKINNIVYFTLKGLHIMIEESMAPANIISGFKACGIYPFNPKAALDHMHDPCYLNLMHFNPVIHHSVTY